MKMEQKVLTAGEWADRMADVLAATALLAHLQGCYLDAFQRCQHPNCADRRQVLAEFDGWRNRANAARDPESGA